MNYTASFFRGPLDKQVRAVQDDRERIVVDTVAGPFPPSPDSPDEWVRIQRHCYELDPLRLQRGEEAHLFYNYVGVCA